jgi:hypothetical protein
MTISAWKSNEIARRAASRIQPSEGGHSTTSFFFADYSDGYLGHTGFMRVNGQLFGRKHHLLPADMNKAMNKAGSTPCLFVYTDFT